MFPAKRMRSGPRRPVEKECFITFDTLGTTQTNNAQHNSPVAETFSGGHITGNLISGASAGNITLALLYVKAGQAIPTLATTDNTAIEPESSVLWAGSFALSANTTPVVIPLNIKIKAMRKMLTNDDIYFSAISSTAGGPVLAATLTLFYKQ